MPNTIARKAMTPKMAASGPTRDIAHDFPEGGRPNPAARGMRPGRFG
jgi:hypothetical protein